MSAPSLLVLDFDGVVCDGMTEFFQSAWLAWPLATGMALPEDRRDELRARFAQLRPAVESGWEMALLPALLAGRDPKDDAALEDEWAAARDGLLERHDVAPRTLADALDSVRDAWIRRDAAGWLRSHRFYPGIADWLRGLVEAKQRVYVLSTKDKRFLDDILAWQRVPIPSARVIGKETPRKPKWAVIQALIDAHGLPHSGDGTWFVEDRLQTLNDLRVDAPHLQDMRLFLATWGYVFPRDVDKARDAAATPLRLADATAAFSAWPR
ncbi:MAG TPA: HAD family hydrolase [Terriglobales bacterium]|nr:HAD family hydrolase [Terriglobales bacterium]